MNKIIKTTRKDINKLFISLSIFFLLFILNLIVPSNNSLGYIGRMWLLFDIYTFIVSIFILIKNKLPNTKYILLSMIFGLLMFLAYEGIYFTSIKTFLSTTLCSLAAFSIFSNYQSCSIPIIKTTKARNFIINILLAILIGSILGTANLLLRGEELTLNINLSCFLRTLSPAIYEEICFRFFIYAFCIYLLKGDITTKSNRFWCYFMMIVPHAIIHTPDAFLHYGVIGGTLNTLLLSLIFGLPLALLQKKKDLLSSMIAHGLFNFIPFCFIGLPF